MTTSCCCNCFCLSKRQAPEEEPNAFDLTWRNYLLPSCVPSIFKRQQPIRLEDDDDLFITPNQGRAVRGYLDDPNDWEFDSMLVNQEFPEFVTRNPFGKTKKKRKHKKHHHHHHHQRALPEDEEIFSEEIQDAEFLGDDQIAHLAYERRKDMDPYGEEGYIENYDRPLSQEMQPPPQKEFYAARAMPYYFVDEDQEYLEQQDEQPEASSSSAAVVAEQAQGLLSERLDDLTDKLVYIRQNIMDINRQDEPDTTTLKTINKADADK
ncbi:hypothetical protein BJV82DRAFT_66710 [Fennellomyces sp. T-0311]|nr:hypothetical protein BJV82DRAFT_66710 [Fennellomyces sp. T-0311]